MIIKVIFIYNLRKQLILSYIVSIIITIYFLKSALFFLDFLILLKLIIFQNVVLNIDNSLPVNNISLRLNDMYLKRTLQFRNVIASFFFLSIFLLDYFFLFSSGNIKDWFVYWLLALVLTLNLFIVSYIFQLVDCWNTKFFTLIPFVQSVLYIVIQICLFTFLKVVPKDLIFIVLFMCLLFQFSVVVFLHQNISFFKAFKNDSI